MAKIVITRSNEFANRLRNATIFVDGQNIGAVGNGDVKDFEVQEGNHSLYAQINWGRSRELNFTISSDEKKYFTLSGYKYSNILAPVTLAILVAHLIASKVFGIHWVAYLIIPSFLVMLYYITLGRKDYLILKEADIF